LIRRLFTAAAAASLLVMIAAAVVAATDPSRLHTRSTWVLGSWRIDVGWHPPLPYVRLTSDPNGDLVQKWPLRVQSERYIKAGPFTAYYSRGVGASPTVAATMTELALGYGGMAVAAAVLPVGWMISAAHRRRRHEATRFPVETVGTCRAREPGLSVIGPGRPVC